MNITGVYVGKADEVVGGGTRFSLFGNPFSLSSCIHVSRCILDIVVNKTFELQTRKLFSWEHLNFSNIFI